MRILLLLPTVPFPPDDGGKLRQAAVALELARRHEVELLCFADDGVSLPPLGDWRRPFRDVTVLPLMPRGSKLAHWLSARPSEVSTFRSPRMAQHVRESIARFVPDVLLVGDPSLTQYVAPHADPIRVLDYLCVATLQCERLQALSTGLRRALWALRRTKFAAYLRRIAGSYDLCVVNSEEDRAALLKAAPAWTRVEVLPNGLNLTDYPMGLVTPRPDTLVFPGALTYQPNLDAARHFVTAILPRIREALPEVRLLITGRTPPGNLVPHAPGVEYTGYVPDVRPVIAGSWACVVPLRAGAGGARFKVLESLALGTPMVATAIGAEGVAVTHGVDILLAEEAATFADLTVKVLKSPELRARLATAGRRLMEEKYDWRVLGAQLMALIDAVQATRPRNKRPV